MTIASLEGSKVALVHDWLNGMRGGEKCLEVLCELFPDADLFTLIHEKGQLSKIIESMKISTSFIQNMPFSLKKYRHYLLLFPLAIEIINSVIKSPVSLSLDKQGLTHSCRTARSVKHTQKATGKSVGKLILTLHNRNKLRYTKSSKY